MLLLDLLGAFWDGLLSKNFPKVKTRSRNVIDRKQVIDGRPACFYQRVGNT